MRNLVNTLIIICQFYCHCGVSHFKTPCLSCCAFCTNLESTPAKCAVAKLPVKGPSAKDFCSDAVAKSRNFATVSKAFNTKSLGDLDLCSWLLNYVSEQVVCFWVWRCGWILVRTPCCLPDCSPPTCFGFSIFLTNNWYLCAWSSCLRFFLK